MFNYFLKYHVPSIFYTCHCQHNSPEKKKEWHEYIPTRPVFPCYRPEEGPVLTKPPYKKSLYILVGTPGKGVMPDATPTAFAIFSNERFRMTRGLVRWNSFSLVLCFYFYSAWARSGSANNLSQWVKQGKPKRVQLVYGHAGMLCRVSSVSSVPIPARQVEPRPCFLRLDGDATQSKWPGNTPSA